jgi:NarL family two-component system sensor histidine kinase YdfH
MDLRWLMGMLTLVATIMYVVLLTTTPAMRRPLPLIALTSLLASHLVLHWLLIRIVNISRWLNGYMFLQGVLFLGIALISANASMIFPLFAGLLGEAIGTLGLTRRGLSASLYYILLLIVSFLMVFNLATAGWMIVGTAAIVVTTVLYTVLFKRQVEARRQAQSLLRDLEAANWKLSEYSARVEELTTAAERQRMARELHDTLSQGLAGLILQLEAVEAHLKGKRSERALTIVEQAKSNARETLNQSRQAISDLRQEGKVDFGKEIRQEAEHFTSSTGIPCAVEIALPEELPEAVGESVLRVATEGLTNIARHARASHATLRIATSDKENEKLLGGGKGLIIEICDDGIGFEPETVKAGHYGLLGMGERVRLAGGNFEVNSHPGEGTRLMIRFPLSCVPTLSESSKLTMESIL